MTVRSRCFEERRYIENADNTYSGVSHDEHRREGLQVGQVPHADLRTARRREETERKPALKAGEKSIPVMISADVVVVQRIDRYDYHSSSVPRTAAVRGSHQSHLHDEPRYHLSIGESDMPMGGVVRFWHKIII